MGYFPRCPILIKLRGDPITCWRHCGKLSCPLTLEGEKLFLLGMQLDPANINIAVASAAPAKLIKITMLFVAIMGAGRIENRSQLSQLAAPSKEDV